MKKFIQKLTMAIGILFLGQALQAKTMINIVAINETGYTTSNGNIVVFSYELCAQNHHMFSMDRCVTKTISSPKKDHLYTNSTESYVQSGEGTVSESFDKLIEKLNTLVIAHKDTGVFLDLDSNLQNQINDQYSKLDLNKVY